MNKLACLSGRFGRPGIVFIGVAALWWLITRYGAYLGAENTPGSNTTADIAESGVALCLLPACDEKICSGTDISTQGP